MPRYYFDVINGQGKMPDDEGKEFLFPDEVRNEASRIALDIARDEVFDQNAMNVKVKVRDEANVAIFTASLDFKTKWHG